MSSTFLKTLIGAACHSAWWALMKAQNIEAPDWWEIPTEQKEDVQAGVEIIVEQLENKNYSAYELIGNSQTILKELAESAHKSWMQRKINLGWTYGPLLDEELKTHPCLVPYNEISAFDKLKDEVFINTVLSLYPYFPGCSLLPEPTKLN